MRVLPSSKLAPFHCIDLKQKKQLSLFSLQALMRYSVRQRERERERKTERERESFPPSRHPPASSVRNKVTEDRPP